MSTSSWVAVGLAGTLAAAVVGVLLTLPWPGAGGRGQRLAATLLGLHAGLVAVGGVVLAGAAVRSWQLVDDEPAEQAADALIEVSRIDGDGRLYALVVLLVAAGTVGAVVLLALASRFARSSEVLPRSIACAVLGLEIGLCGFGLAEIVSGSRNALALGAVLNLPLAMAALVACWPPHPPAPVQTRRR